MVMSREPAPTVEAYAGVRYPERPVRVFWRGRWHNVDRVEHQEQHPDRRCFTVRPKAIADPLERLYGVRYDPGNEILITIGVSEGLMLALLAILNPGDELLSPDPYYVAYRPACQIAGGAFVPGARGMETEFRVSAQDLEAHLTDRSKAILLGYPSNPTGAQMTREGVAEGGAP